MTAHRSFWLIWLGLTLGGLLTIGLAAYRVIGCEGQPFNNNVAPTEAQAIFGEQIIGQSFTAPRDGLNRLDLLFQTYRRPARGEVRLRLRELSDPAHPLSGPLLFETTFEAATIRDRAWRSFSFDPRPDSRHRAYLITLQAPQADPATALTVGGIERNVYTPGTAYLGSVPIRADIAFRACFELTPAQKLAHLAEQVTQARPGPWGSPLFYVLIGGAYILLLMVFFRAIVGLPLKQPQEVRNPSDGDTGKYTF